MSKIKDYVVTYNLYEYLFNGEIKSEKEERAASKAYSAEDAYFQIKIQLDKSYSGPEYGSGQAVYGFSIIRVEPFEES